MAEAAEAARQICHSGPARGFAGRRCVQQIDGNRAGRTDGCPGMFRQRQRNLQEAAGPDEIVGEVRPQRIAPPGGARDVTAALAKQRVIEQGHDRAGGWQGVQHAAQRDAPQHIAVQTLALEQAIGGRPVAKLLSGSAKQAGQRVTPQTGQGGKAQGARPLEGALLRESGTRLIEERIPVSHHALPRLVFF